MGRAGLGWAGLGQLDWIQWFKLGELRWVEIFRVGQELLVYVRLLVVPVHC